MESSGANVLVSVAIKSNSKYPLLFLPNFVEDWINGTYSRKMMDKYHIHTYTDFNALTSLTLKFDKQRAKGHNGDSREKKFGSAKLETAIRPPRITI